MAFPSLRWALLPLWICSLQTSLDSFVSHPSLDKHRQEMNVVLQWFTPYWKHLLSKKSIQSSFGFICLLFSLALADKYLFIWLFPKAHLTMFDFCPQTCAVFNLFFFIKSKIIKLKYLILCQCSCISFKLSWLFNLFLFSFCFFHSPPFFSQNAKFLHVSLPLCYLC